jgi:hypothetical protein
MGYRVQIVRMPAFLASALINGDTSGLEDRDLPWVQRANEYCAPGHIVSIEGEPYFAWRCELPGYTLGCDVADYVVLYPRED